MKQVFHRSNKRVNWITPPGAKVECLADFPAAFRTGGSSRPPAVVLPSQKKGETKDENALWTSPFETLTCGRLLRVRFESRTPTKNRTRRSSPIAR